MIEELFHTRVGIIIVSIIWGLGLSTLFKFHCDKPPCQITTFRGPPTDSTNFAWDYGDGKCYTLHPKISSCY